MRLANFQFQKTAVGHVLIWLVNRLRNDLDLVFLIWGWTHLNINDLIFRTWIGESKPRGLVQHVSFDIRPCTISPSTVVVRKYASRCQNDTDNPSYYHCKQYLHEQKTQVCLRLSFLSLCVGTLNATPTAFQLYNDYQLFSDFAWTERFGFVRIINFNCVSVT